MLSEKIRLKLIAIHNKFAIISTQFITVIFAILILVIGIAIYDIYSKIKENNAGQEQSRIIRKTGRASEPLIEINFRGDYTTPISIKKAVEQAILDLDRVSCGLAKLSIVWNYNKELDLLGVTLRGDSVIQGLSVLEIESSMGREDSSDLLGLTRSAKSPRWNPVWIFLVNERLEDNSPLAEWTALHEIGHALGMDHVKIGLMEPRAPYFFGLEDKPEWSAEDQQEFCRIYKCDPSVFIRCEIK